MNEEKLSLVKLSTKSWHYKLMKLVLGSVAPTPQNMYNLCPYFWLMFFSIIVSPIVLPVKGVFWILDFIVKGLDNFIYNTKILPVANDWYDNLSDIDAYKILQQNLSISKSYKKFMRISDISLSEDNFIYNWWEAKFNKKAFLSGDYNGKYSVAFQDWTKNQEEILRKIYEMESKEAMEKRNKRDQYEKKLSNFRNNIDEFLEKISGSISSWKNLIRWTKRFVGLIVTSIGLVAIYFIVNFLGREVLWLVEHWDWNIALRLLIFISIIGAGIGIILLLMTWLTYIQEKGTNLWYVKVLYYLALGIYWPFKIIFYYFLWHLIFVNLAFFIAKVSKLLWGSLLGFLGIFGEYFGASYTDYCPGIEWEKNE